MMLLILFLCACGLIQTTGGATEEAGHSSHHSFRISPENPRARSMIAALRHSPDFEMLYSALNKGGRNFPIRYRRLEPANSAGKFIAGDPQIRLNRLFIGLPANIESTILVHEMVHAYSYLVSNGEDMVGYTVPGVEHALGNVMGAHAAIQASLEGTWRCGSVGGRPDEGVVGVVRESVCQKLEWFRDRRWSSFIDAIDALYIRESEDSMDFSSVGPLAWVHEEPNDDDICGAALIYLYHAMDFIEQGYFTNTEDERVECTLKEKDDPVSYFNNSVKSYLTCLHSP